MKSIGQVLPRPGTPKHVLIGDNKAWHDLHPVLNSTQCRIRIDAARKEGNSIKGAVKLPANAEVCGACIKAQVELIQKREQERLHRTYERASVQNLITKKNTLKRKQVFNKNHGGFSFD